MEPTTPFHRLSVTEAAERLGVSPSTLRRLSDTYAPHLSAGVAKRPRTYSEHDLERLSLAVRLKAQAVNPATIAERLAVTQVGEVVAELPATTPQTGHSGVLAPPAVVEALTGRIEALERRQREIVLGGYLAGVASGLLAGMVLMWAAYLLARI